MKGEKMVNAGSWYIGSQVGKTIGKLLIQSAEREAWEEYADLVLRQKEEEEKERRMEIQRQRQLENEMKNYTESDEYKSRIADEALGFYKLYRSELKQRIEFDELFNAVKHYYDNESTNAFTIDLPRDEPYLDFGYYYWIAKGLLTRDLFFEALGEYYKLNTTTKATITKFDFINTYIINGRKEEEENERYLESKKGLEYKFDGPSVKKNTNYAINNIYIEQNYYDDEEQYYFELLDDYFEELQNCSQNYVAPIKEAWTAMKKLPFEDFKLLFGTLVKESTDLLCYDLELLKSILKEYNTFEELFYKKEEDTITTDTCSKCGKELNDDFEFCPYCGTPKPKVSYCQKCNEFYENFEFCPKCGAELIEKEEFFQEIQRKNKEIDNKDPNVNYDYFEPDNITCPHCGHEHMYETDYCEICGHDMNEYYY